MFIRSGLMPQVPEKDRRQRKNKVQKDHLYLMLANKS